jgi:pyridoxal phosphate enzyme (YggS family)
LLSTDITTRLSAIRQRIAQACHRCGRDPASIRLIGVSKTRDADEIIAAYRAGLVDFGENYAQELVAKAKLVADANIAPRWHFLGGLQTNKVRSLIPVVSGIQTVDRPSLIKELAKRATQPLEVFVEVNVGDEQQKAGCHPKEAADLCRQIMEVPNLKLVGLMCVPPIANTAEATRPYFRSLREKRDELRAKLSISDNDTLSQLSMGMSADFEVAIEEGATTVRVGTDLFGPR